LGLFASMMISIEKPPNISQFEAKRKSVSPHDEL
jgi:hypothetical protein